MVKSVEAQASGGTPVLKEIRLFLGLTQAQFAALLGTTEKTVSRRERGGGIGLDWEEVCVLEKTLSSKGKRLSDFPSVPEQTQSA
jgi:transcriptional regulator with XRE-family HTH domain